MLAIVDAPPGEMTWHQRALDLADASPSPDARRWRGSLWNNIGWARFDAGDLDGALEAFETAPSRHDASRSSRRSCASPSGASPAASVPSAGPPTHSPSRSAWSSETAAAGEAEDGYMSEEIGECLLALGREDEARPYFARAAELLGADARSPSRSPTGSSG